MTQQFGRVCRWPLVRVGACVSCVVCRIVRIGPKPRTDTLSLIDAFTKPNFLSSQTCAPSSSHVLPFIPMSTSNQSACPSTSTDRFTAIFNAASTEYTRITGKRLDAHPFAVQLNACDSPKAVSDLLHSQAQAFTKFRKGDEELMVVLDPTVHILFTFSAALGEGIGLVSPLISFSMISFQRHAPQPFSPAKTIFTGIGVLLGVRPSQSSLSWI